jgi:hypothetical protein
LLSKEDGITYYELLVKAEKVGNSNLMNCCNPNKWSKEEVINSVEYIFYGKNKWESKTLNCYFPDNVKIGYVKFDLNNSVFKSEGIYRNTNLLNELKAFEQHPLKVVLTPDGRCRLSLHTHHPRDINKSTFLSNYDFDGQRRGQFQSMNSIEVPRDMIVNIDPIGNKITNVNINLVNQVLTNNYPQNVYTEESFFHYHKTNKLDSVSLLEAQEEIAFFDKSKIIDGVHFFLENFPR